MTKKSSKSAIKNIDQYFVNVYRSRRHEITIKKVAEVAEKVARSSVDSLVNDSSSSVRILQLKTRSS